MKRRINADDDVHEQAEACVRGFWDRPTLERCELVDLIASALAEARAEEREACARVADQQVAYWSTPSMVAHSVDTIRGDEAKFIANHIRGRSRTANPLPKGGK